jgi:hypothetical protein
MNRQELKIELDKLHVPRSNYSLDGSIQTNASILDHAHGHWIIFSVDERGNRSEEKTFQSEDEACAYLLNKNKKWFNYDLRDIHKIYSLLYTRPVANSNMGWRQYFFSKLDFVCPDYFLRFYN